MKKVGIFNETTDPVPDIKWEEVVSECSRKLGRTVKPLTVVFVSKEKICQFNNLYRKINKPTNILSFGDDRELFFCLDVIKEEAAEISMKLELWLQKLLIHGILHLEGYTHSLEEEAVRMESLEDAIVEALGS